MAHENFIVYQIHPGSGWIQTIKKVYDAHMKAPREGVSVRRLAILPEYHAIARRWFSPANGWFHTVELRRDTQVVFKTELRHGGDRMWVQTLLTYMYMHRLIPSAVRSQSTQYLEEVWNIEYTDIEVQTKKELR